MDAQVAPCYHAYGPSLKLLQVKLGDDDSVEEKNCQCPVGKGKMPCHHMGALLIYGMNNLSSTSGSCD